MAIRNRRMMIAAAKPRGMRMGRPAPYSDDEDGDQEEEYG